MDKPQDKNIPSFAFLPPLGVKTPLQPLPPLGRANSWLSLNEPLSHKQRRRRQKNTRDSDVSALANQGKQSNFKLNLKPIYSENTETNLFPNSLTLGQELVLTPPSSSQNQSNKAQPSSNSSQDLENIAKEVYRLLRQRVNIERERRGRPYKPLF
jgi:hypothetical protein